MIRINETITLPDRRIEERFVRSVGPRGQNPHKYGSAVELRLDVARSSLPKDVAQRLVNLAGRRMTKDGVLVVVGRQYSSQLRNREAALRMLVALLRRAAAPANKRLPTEPSAAIRENQMMSKERKSVLKQARRRPKQS